MELSESYLLLSTKFKIPTPRKNYILRSDLFQKLDTARDMSVVFVCGAAGTGKTTLISSYIWEQRKQNNPYNLSWLSLDSSSSDIRSFWLYFATAVSSFVEGSKELIDFLRLNYDIHNLEPFIILLVNKLCSEQDYFMVLDDVHTLVEPELLHSFEFFLKSMPENFHLIMLSREEPAMYLGDLAVSGRLLYIDHSQMYLTKTQEQAFLTDTLGLEKASPELEMLMDYAEGWIGGLQLAVAAKVLESGKNRLLLTGRGIATVYLNREIFEALSEQERDFLIKTGFLTYFGKSICQTLFKELTSSLYNEMINGFIQKNLFIICLDEEQGIYRYHNILQDFLRQKFHTLSHKEQMEYYKMAASCFEQENDQEEALRLWYECGAYTDVLRVAKSMSGQTEIYKYLDQLPVEVLLDEPELLAQCFIYNIAAFHIERSRLLYHAFKQHYGDTDLFTAIRFAEVYVIDDSNAIPKYHALRADQIDQLKLGDVMKAVLLVENAIALMNIMEYDEAKDCIKKALSISSGSNTYVDFFAVDQLAQIYEETGDLVESLKCYEKGNLLLKSTSFMLGIEANYYFGLMGVYMRQMELQKTEELLSTLQDFIIKQHLSSPITDVTLGFHQAELNFLTGDDNRAKEEIEALINNNRGYSILTLSRLLFELDCRNLLTDKMATEALAEMQKETEYANQPFFKLLKARISLKSMEPGIAMEQVDEVLSFSRKKHNKLRVVEAGIFKINLLLRETEPHNKRELMNLLLEAIHYAYADGIKQPFHLEREILLPLLEQLEQAYKTNKNLLNDQEVLFLQDILALCKGKQAEKEPDRTELLSLRELEVLKELTRGITNKEIAERLCISHATVKTHVLSIFGKLGVSSRMMAVEKAREKGII